MESSEAEDTSSINPIASISNSTAATSNPPPAANAGSPNPTRVGWPSPSRQLAGLYTEGRVAYGGSREGEVNSISPHLNHHTRNHSLSHSTHGLYSAPSPKTYPPQSAMTPRSQPSYYRDRTTSWSSGGPSSKPYSNPNDDHRWSSSLSHHQAGLPPPPAPSNSSASYQVSPPTNVDSSTVSSSTSPTKKRDAKDVEEEDAGTGKNKKYKKEKRKRATMACTRCRGQKLRCDVS